MNKDDKKETTKESSSEEERAYHSAFNLNTLRHDHDLFNDDDNVKHRVINVKRVNLPRKGEDWELYEDNRVVLTLKGTRFTNKEKKFLYSVEGMKFLVNGYKNGWRSVVKFKSEMQDLI